jgi:hypothetical protein
MLTAKERSHDERSCLTQADQSSQTTEMLWSFISRLALPSMKDASKGFASPWNLQHVSCHSPLSFCSPYSLQSIPRYSQWHPLSSLCSGTKIHANADEDASSTGSKLRCQAVKFLA